MRTQPQEIIAKLEADNSRLGKEKIIQRAMEEGLDEFFEGVRMCLDPLVTFGVKQVPESKVDGQGLKWDVFKTLATQLQNRELITHTYQNQFLSKNYVDVLDDQTNFLIPKNSNNLENYRKQIRTLYSLKDKKKVKEKILNYLELQI